MSQVTLPGKEQALMRVAGSRVAVLDAMGAAKSHAQSCVRALPVSPAMLMRLGTIAGVAASVVGAMAGLRRKKKIAEKAAVKQGSSSLLMQVALQMLTPALLPVLQRALQNYVKTQPSDSPGRPAGF